MVHWKAKCGGGAAARPWRSQKSRLSGALPKLVDRLRRAADKLPLTSGHDVTRTDDWFDRHGGKAVFFGRMIPLFRSLISVPAVVARMPLGRFLLYTTLGSLIWNTVFVLAGHQLGANWTAVEAYAGVFQNVVIACCLVAAVVFVVSRVRRNRRDRAVSATPATRGTVYWTARRPDGN